MADTKNINVNFECLVALTPGEWETVFDTIGSHLEELAFEFQRKSDRAQRAWTKNDHAKRALAEIYGQLAEHFFVLRDSK